MDSKPGQDHSSSSEGWGGGAAWTNSGRPVAMGGGHGLTATEEGASESMPDERRMAVGRDNQADDWGELEG